MRRWWPLAVTAIAAVAYAKLIRPRASRWGASDEEVAMPLPGDEVVTKADYTATRAITIDAPKELVWPWLVQIGSGRAGWYSIDRLDNGGVPSAERIVPELQDLAVGDLVPMVPGKEIGVWVKELQRNDRMLLWDREGRYSWEWVLRAESPTATRLISRLRATYPPPLSPKWPYVLLATTGDVVMSVKQLRGIKRRAERSPTGAGSVGS